MSARGNEMGRLDRDFPVCRDGSGGRMHLPDDNACRESAL
jgi:hypothetical protein